MPDGSVRLFDIHVPINSKTSVFILKPGHEDYGAVDYDELLSQVAQSLYGTVQRNMRGVADLDRFYTAILKLKHHKEKDEQAKGL